MNALVLPGFNDVVDILKNKGITDLDEQMSWLVANNKRLWIEDKEFSPLSAILAGRGGEVAAVAMFYTKPVAPAATDAVVQMKDFIMKDAPGFGSNDETEPPAAA